MQVGVVARTTTGEHVQVQVGMRRHGQVRISKAGTNAGKHAQVQAGR